MFEDILSKARTSKNSNNAKYKQMKKEADELKAQKEAEKTLKVVAGYMNTDYRKENCSSELLGLIDRYGFEIKSYELNMEEKESYYDTLLETYHCKYNDWLFDINNYSDIDIAEGIFSIRNLKNAKTGEKVEYYCDLGCRNTCEGELKKLLRFLECKSEKEFAKKEYAAYIELPSILRQAGVDFTVKLKKFTLNNPCLALSINYENKENQGMYVRYKKVLLRILNHWSDELQLVITKDKGWEDNSDRYASALSYGEHFYSFKYNSSDDASELIRCIDAYYDHINGNIGFFEDGKYYSNSDVDRFFDSLRNDKKAFDKWNHYAIIVNGVTPSYGKCGSNRNNILNKYKGIEINAETELVFNDAAQWSEGDEINKSIIKVIYDKNIDANNCILIVENYIYTDDDEYLQEIYDEESAYEYSMIMNPQFMVGKVEFRGSFSEVMTKIKEYVYTMCNIYEIPL